VDDGDARQRRRPPVQRQHAVVRQHDHGLLGEAAGERLVPRRVEIDLGRRLVLERIGVEQSQLFLLRESAQDGPVDERLVERTGADTVRQRLQVGVSGGQLDVDAGLERERGGLPTVGGDRVHDLEERDREVVGDDDAVESPPLAQNSREVLGARRHRNAVDVGVRVHQRPCTALEDRHLERREEDVGDLAGARAHRRMVAARPGARVTDEVLQRGVHTGLLQAEHVGGADRADQVRVLADALVHAAPARVANDVEDRGEALVDAELPHGVADRARSLLDQVGVERRTPRERRRERGGLPRGEAGEALLVDEGGDAKTRLTLEAALLGPQPGGALGRLHRAGAIDARVVADAVLGDLGEIAGVQLAGGHLGLHRRDRTVLVKPVAHELGQLLLERHLSVERSHALGHLRHGGDDVGHRALSPLS
jgi:hypothetical protein